MSSLEYNKNKISKNPDIIDTRFLNPVNGFLNIEKSNDEIHENLEQTKKDFAGIDKSK